MFTEPPYDRNERANVTADSYLEGQLLLAMPNMEDPRFDRSVIYICSHSKDGAMGLVVNEIMPELSFAELLNQLDIDVSGEVADTTVFRGGPVESGRGFVLHSADFVQETTMIVSETLALTATVDILKAIAEGSGPQHSLLALGYAGWGAGQIEEEIKNNSWMTVRGEDEVIFYTEPEDKWARAMAMLGIDLSMLSNEAGHA